MPRHASLQLGAFLLSASTLACAGAAPATPARSMAAPPETPPLVPTPAQPSDAARPAPTDAAALVAHYLEGTLAASPERARALGLHAYDGKVPTISQATVDAEVARARAYLARTALLDLAQLADPTRIDVELTRLSAERTIFDLVDMRRAERILAYTGLFDVSSYLLRDYAPIAVRTGALLDHLEAATRQVDAVLGLLAPAQPRTHLEIARGMLAGLDTYFRTDLAQATADARAKDPALSGRYDRVVPAGLAAVQRLITWIDTVGKQNATDDFALGEKRFLRMLEVNEGLTISLDALKKMAQADYQRNYDAFVAAARKINKKLSVKAVAAKVAAEHLQREAVLPAATKQLDGLLAFIEKNDIITIGSEDRATVAVTPPFMRYNSAFLDMAGPLEKAKGSFYYITPPNPSWDAKKQETYLPYFGDLLWTSVHEVYPGHFVQGLQLRRAPSLAEQMADSYAFVEGWAHYSEQMMFDAGYGKTDARMELGQLSNALLRNCRFLAAIGLHTEGMTVAAADALFREKCLIDDANATEQAVRGTFDPGYLSYTLGKLEIFKLREAFYAKRGTRSLRAFHDWLLSFGNAPLALIARRL